MKIDQLPNFKDEYTLTEQQISAYQKNGHIMLREVALKDEIGRYETVINREVKTMNYHDKPVSERGTYGKAFIQITNLRVHSEAVMRFVLAKRFAKIAADLMGVSGVRVFADQALFKEPGGGYTPWHQDQIYWPMDTPNIIMDIA